MGRRGTGACANTASSLLLGVATGLLWAPCAGPVLGLILTGAALQGANAQTTLLLLAYAAGAATSLALALLVGGLYLVHVLHAKSKMEDCLMSGRRDCDGTAIHG